MKTKKIISALIAGIIATTAALSASAATITDVTVYGSTTVSANIVDPGYVSYVITIPDKVDFGTLTMPDSNTDSYVFSSFDVEATELKIKNNQAVTVYVKDACSDFETSGQFCISQKDVTDPFTINYDIFTGTVNDTNVADSTAINSTATPGSFGYHLCTFLYGKQGTTQNATLALNQKALYGQELSAIAGDYSGNITFHSALVERG